MFERFERMRHKIHPELCLDHLTWRGNFLECACCDYVVATCFSGELSVFERYLKHSDKIEAYYATHKPKSKIDDWQGVLDLKSTVVENSQGQLDEMHEETQHMKEQNDFLGIDDPIPFEEIEFDDEDSAATGDFYMGMETDTSETMDE